MVDDNMLVDPWIEGPVSGAGLINAQPKVPATRDKTLCVTEYTAR
jgi:hypothetical protein